MNGFCIVAIILVIVALAALIWAWATQSNSSNSTHNLTLSGGQEVPPNGSPAVGTTTVTVDTPNRQITWTPVQLSGLTSPITAAHFHLGPAGVNGPIIRTITPQELMQGGKWTLLDIEPLTDAFLQAASKGGIYINVHTIVFPDGEIRAQVA